MEREFYTNKDIFITGGSGVVGSSVIEKLLRSCDVNRIFILLRIKKGLSAEQRLEKLCKAKIFNFVKETNPQALQRLTAVPGNALAPQLGITPEYADMMANVSIVLHCAATVSFDEPIANAVKLNVGGTYEALQFAKTLKHLEIFMHVSTYFSNPYLTYIEDKVYEAPMDWRTCLKMIEDESKLDTLNAITKKMITGFPNTYTFTKNLSESMINDHRHELPVAIFRPSIVLFSIREPTPSFPTPPNGAMGLFILVAVGILKTVFLRKDVIFDVTPLDIGAKSMLYYTYDAQRQYKRKGQTEKLPLYTFSSNKSSTYTFYELVTITEERGVFGLSPFEKSLLIPGCIYTNNPYYYMFLVYTKQILPGLLIDALLKLFGYGPVVMPLVRKAFVALHVMEPFMFNNWQSEGYSLAAEINSLPKDSVFAFKEDIDGSRTLDELMVHIVQLYDCVRKYTLNEDPKTVPKTRRILKCKIIFYNIIRGYLLYLVLRWLCRYVMNRM